MNTKRAPEMKSRRFVSDAGRKKKVEVRAGSALSGGQAACYQKFVKGNLHKNLESIDNMSQHLVISGMHFSENARENIESYILELEGNKQNYVIDSPSLMIVEKLLKENDELFKQIQFKNNAIQQSIANLIECVEMKQDAVMLPSMSMEELKALSDRMYAVTLEEMQRELYDDAE